MDERREGASEGNKRKAVGLLRERQTGRGDRIGDLNVREKSGVEQVGAGFGVDSAEDAGKALAERR